MIVKIEQIFEKDNIAFVSEASNPKPNPARNIYVSYSGIGFKPIVGHSYSFKPFYFWQSVKRESVLCHGFISKQKSKEEDAAEYIKERG